MRVNFIDIMLGFGTWLLNFREQVFCSIVNQKGIFSLKEIRAPCVPRRVKIPAARTTQ